MFRFKRAIPVDYDTQGYIYFTSRRYRKLSARTQRKIEGLCMTAGGEHYQALLEFVTTDAGAVEICAKHYISESTLERAVRKYYVNFAEKL